MAVLLSLLFPLFFFSSSFPSTRTPTIIESLINSNYVSMALTLQLTSPTLIPDSPATIFSPSNEVFSKFGQPNLSLMQYHISPRRFSPEILESLAVGTEIPTLSPNQSLFITTNSEQISINEVPINVSSIFDDGSVIIYGIDRFFDPSFSISGVSGPVTSPSLDFGCTDPTSNNPAIFGDDSFSRLLDLLKSRGYSVMAAILDLQLLGFGDGLKLTLFAPMDEVFEEAGVSYKDYASILKRHLIPCKLSWADLASFDEGMELQTLLKGFSINLHKSGDILLLNEVPIVFPDMYYGESVVVHGLRQMFTVPKQDDQDGGSFMEDQGDAPDDTL